MDEKIVKFAKALCQADGWGNPDMVMYINDSAFGSPAPNVAIPVWKKYVKAAEAALKEL